MPPVALHALLTHATIEAMTPAALVAAQVWNVNNDWEKNPKGYTVAHFLKPYGQEEDDEAAESAEIARKILNGTLEKPSKEALDEFIARNKKLITPPDRRPRFR